MGSWWSTTAKDHNWSKGYQPAAKSTGALTLVASAKSHTTPRERPASVSVPSQFFSNKLCSRMCRKGSSTAALSSSGGGMASQLEKKGDFRRLVESKKITIGAPIKDTFQHLDHVGVNDVAAKHLQ